MYDIIGDIHGHARALERILKKLDYHLAGSGYVHSSRKAVFVGDYVDRGPEIIRSIEIVKNMVENRAAYAIAGNHEFNVLCYYTKDKLGQPLREQNLKNSTQIKETIKEFKHKKEARKPYLKWLRNLPIYLELEGIRIVHACWDEKALTLLKEINPEMTLNKKFLREIMSNRRAEFEALMLFLKGREFKLPGDMMILDSYGFKRTSFRIKWWDCMDGESFKSLAFGNKFQLPDYSIPKELHYSITPYPEDEIPVFFGHYCLNDTIGVIRKNLCCVDGCVVNGGRLAAYRWDGEKTLSPAKMVFEEGE